MPCGTEAKVPSEEDVSLVLPGDRKGQWKIDQKKQRPSSGLAWDPLRATGGDSRLERGHSSARSHPEPYLSGLCQGRVFGAGEQRVAGQEEFIGLQVRSAHELSVLFSSVGKIWTAQIQSLETGQAWCRVVSSARSHFRNKLYLTVCLTYCSSQK